MRTLRRKDPTARRSHVALIGGAILVTLFLARLGGDGQPDSASQPTEEEAAPQAAQPVGDRAVASSPQGDAFGTIEPGGVAGPSEAALDPLPPDVTEAETADGDDLDSHRVEPIFVAHLELAEGAPTVALSGFDPYAPRDLVAWRILDGRSAIMSRGESGEDGSIQFPALLAPRDGLEVVVTEAGLTPESPGASERRKLAPRTPAAPHATILEAGPEEYQVRIVAAETTGRVLLADLDGNVFAAYAIPLDPSPTHRVFDVALSVPPTDTMVWMAHELEDGRLSEWRPIPLERFDPDSLSDDLPSEP